MLARHAEHAHLPGWYLQQSEHGYCEPWRCECAIRFESAATTFAINKEADYISKELAKLSSAEFRNNTDFTKSVLLEAFGSTIDYCTTRFALLRYHIYALVL